MEPTATDVSVAVVGSGFSGLGMAIRLKQEGIEDFVVLERAADVGGTWYANTYPGCACDVPSHLYSYSFAPNPDWSRTYSGQPEIEAYLKRCCERFGIEPHLRLGHEVTSASWSEDEGRWHVETPRGTFRARVLVAGPGPLTEPRIPDLPGLETFEGASFHSARWDHGHDLTGERVVSVGTGASAIQIVPAIQPRVERLHVIQRTPPWVMPHTNRGVTRLERRLYRALPALQRLVRGGVYAGRETFVLGFVKDPRLMRVAERIARAHMRKHIDDPELLEKVTPDYTIGCKRILPSNRWYRALAQPNVELVTEGIAEVRPRSVVTGDGVERAADTIVFSTGFHVADVPVGERIRGADGRTLAETWGGSPRAYLGTAVAGFPNLFMLLGPNTGLGHSSMVYMIESQIAYVMGALRAMADHGAERLEVRAEAQAAYNERIDRQMRGTVWSSGCASWYLDESGRNATLWPDWTWRFRRRTARFDPAAYRIGGVRSDGAGPPASRPPAPRTARRAAGPRPSARAGA
jgi:cation diffusion facilitator CzcD-associated flavoprotein CzcO